MSDTQCEDCDGGPDVIDHEPWCEKGHGGLVYEVERLRGVLAGLKVEVGRLLEVLGS